jgi:hypothetical protein
MKVDSNRIALALSHFLIFAWINASAVCFALQQDDQVDEVKNSLEKRTAEALFVSCKDENKSVRNQSYQMLATNKKLIGLLDEAQQLELIEAGFADPSSSHQSLALLEHSRLGQLRKNKILFSVFGDQNEKTRGLILKEFRKNSDAVVLQIVGTIRDDIEGDHRGAVEVLEKMGIDSAKAVPTLRAHFDALQSKSQASKSQASKSDTSTFDYLHLVYAIAEIGTSANDAMPIALAAVEEKGETRVEYRIAGLIALKKLLTEFDKAPDVRPEDAILAAADPNHVGKFRKYAESMIAQYDSNENGQLDAEETSKMRRPPNSADFNLDGAVSKNELLASLVQANTRQSRPQKKRVQSVRDQVRKSLDQK